MNNAQKTAARLTELMPIKPTIALVLGSGFHAVRQNIEVLVEIPHSKLPGFPTVRVDGHVGKLLVGKIGGIPVLVLCGRAHYYEGYSMAEVTFPIRVLAEAGIQTVLLTNASGGINPKFRPGDFMVLTDHINLMGANPLRGELASGKNCFVDLSQVYDSVLNKLLQKAARKAKARLHGGVYLAVSGPTYETPAEIRAFARLGADAVGMSTVPEAIVARQCGIRVAGLSCITNLAAGKSAFPLSHVEVLAMSEKVQHQANELLVHFLRLYSQS